MQTRIISNSNDPKPKPAPVSTSVAGTACPRPQHRPTLAARIVRGLFLTASKPGVPNLSLLAKAVSSQVMRRRHGCLALNKTEVAPVIVLTGPSGGGKSLLLGAIERELMNPGCGKDAGQTGRVVRISESLDSSVGVGAPSAGKAETRPLIVRADLLRQFVFVQGVRAGVSRRANKGKPAGAYGSSSHRVVRAPLMLTCEPPLHLATENIADTAVTGDILAMSRTVLVARQYHTRIDPADVRAVHHWLACLASAGMADAGVLLLPLHKLSAGQRARYTLAVAMHRCIALQALAASGGGGPSAQVQSSPWRVLLVDELGSALDAITAVSVAISLRRWSVANNIALVVATADPRMVSALKPQLEIELPLHSGLAAPKAISRATSRARAKP